ncbi:MAG: hemolysin family protein [Erysipelotrichaceae bacterium]|nr:hemolysin family protein [Erysipelotrichaceae bacterium]MDY5252248.1 hemolysin family protein [Erysipelotrichaceae bacterium]
MEIGIIIFCLICSSFFSATETAFSSANRIRLKNYAADGNKKAAKSLKLIDSYDKFLSTVLIGNNIVNIGLSTIAAVMFTRMLGEVNGPTVSTIVTTIIVLIFGEILPKTLAKQAPEVFCIKVVNLISAIEIIFTPLVLISQGIQWIVSKMVKIEDDESDITDELMTMVEEAENDGDLEAHESDLITAAIEFNDLDVKDILTPRVDIVAIDIKDSLNKIEEKFRYNTFSRLPVYENTIDNIVGVIHEKDFYALYNGNSSKKSIKDILQNTIFTSPHTKISNLLKQLQTSKIHMAVVLDEFGGTSGIITMEDIIEELVGEIWDEHDIVKQYYEQIDENTYLVKGSCEVDDLFERLGIEEDDDKEHDYITVSGWVTAEFESFPKVKESFVYQNIRVTVEKMLERKIEEVKVEILHPEEDKEE